MAHARQGIRRAIVAAVTGLTTTTDNVVNWHLHAAAASDRPELAVMVAADAEGISDTIEDELGNLETRDLPVTIEGRVEQSGSSSQAALLDTLDDICAEVEIALTADVTLGGLVEDIKLDSTAIEVDGSGERPIGKITMEWLARYEVDRTNPAA